MLRHFALIIKSAARSRGLRMTHKKASYTAIFGFTFALRNSLKFSFRGISDLHIKKSSKRPARNVSHFSLNDSTSQILSLSRLSVYLSGQIKILYFQINEYELVISYTVST